MPYNLLTNSLSQDMLCTVVLAEHFACGHTQCISQGGRQRRAKVLELVDGSSGIKLRTYEGGERGVPWKNKECGEKGLGVELEEYEEPLLEH